MDWSLPGYPVLHHLSEFVQIHVHWVNDTISFSVVPLSSCPQYFLASGSFPMCQLFTPSGQKTGASASASVLPMNIQGWFPLELTGLISLQPKGLSRVFSSITVQKCQFFSAQPFLWSNTHICTWLLEKAIALTILPANESANKNSHLQSNSFVTLLSGPQRSLALELL